MRSVEWFGSCIFSRSTSKTSRDLFCQQRAARALRDDEEDAAASLNTTAVSMCQGTFLVELFTDEAPPQMKTPLCGQLGRGRKPLGAAQVALKAPSHR